MKKPFYFNNIKTFFFIFILLFILHIIYFPHEAFAMDPYDNISDEDMLSDEDARDILTIYQKENYICYNGNRTYNNRRDLLDSLWRGRIPWDSSFNDYYDGENYFDLPITMIYGNSKNINISDGVYFGCIAKNIDGLMIWPEDNLFFLEFVKDYTQVISKDSNISSVSLGTRMCDECVFIYIKCQDINNHIYHWTIWERTHVDKVWSYITFRKRWDNETNIWSNIDNNIRKDIIIEVKNLLGIKRLDGSIRKTIRSEIEKLVDKI